MSIPDYQTLMLPLLHFANSKKEYTKREVWAHLAKEFNLSREELEQRLPSGKQLTFDNRVSWAGSYLKNSGLLNVIKRGVYRISEKGRQVIANPPDKIDTKFLEQFPEFITFRQRISSEKNTDTSHNENKTPEETFESANQRIRQNLGQEILDRILTCSPEFFEQLVVDLLVKMGYGGSRQDAGQRIGQSGDGGVDGIIKEDRLGLDVIYIQAKRWKNGIVGRPEIQKFVGALQGKRARKGVFITTSRYANEAIEYAETIDTKVILIDGHKLAELMIDFDVGVSTLATYSIKRIDSDFFEEELPMPENPTKQSVHRRGAENAE